MRTFKRIFALLLAVLLTLPVGMVANAADTETEEAYHPLITHWDFEDDPTTEENEAFLDKADGDDTLFESVSGKITAENGIATVPQNAGVYLYATSADEKSDLYSMANKTIIVKAKLYDDLDQSGATKRKSVSGFMGKEGCFGFGLTNANLGISYTFYNSKKASEDTVYYGQVCTTKSSSQKITLDEYCTFVMNFDYKVVDGKEVVVVKQYMATEDAPSDFVLLSEYSVEDEAPNNSQSKGKVYVSIDGCINNDGNFILGKRYDVDTDTTDRFLNAAFDDVKIYEGVLTPAQLVDDNTPTFRASQIATAKSGVTKADTFAVRFVGTINAVTMDTLGYTLTANTASVADKDLSGTVNNVYGAINANTEKGVQGYTAKADFYSGGIFTYTIYDIPTSELENGGYVEFTVTPYSKTGKATLTGESYTVRVELADGENLDMDDYNSYKTTITKIEG